MQLSILKKMKEWQDKKGIWNNLTHKYNSGPICDSSSRFPTWKAQQRAPNQIINKTRRII